MAWTFVQRLFGTKGSKGEAKNRLQVVLVYDRLGLTAEQLDALRKDMVNIDSISPDDPRRIQFNAWHAWSTRAEIGVLLSGLIVVYLNSRSS